jgi:arginase family enzyme
VADGALLDAGDVETASSLEGIHERQRRVVGSMLEHGKRVIVLGGGNDVSYPDVSALSRVARGKVLAFNIDRHFDVRESHHAHRGTPYRQLLEERRLEPRNLYQMGRTPGANSPAYERYLERKGVPCLSLEEIRKIGVEKAFRSVLHRRGAHEVEAVFWGFDMDAVRSADAPGVSAGYPVGFTAAEVCGIAAEAGRESRTRILEISECNPEHDIDGRTAKLAAMMVVSYLEALDPGTLETG